MPDIWLVELTTDVRTWRWASTPGYQTHPRDTPSCAPYLPRVVDPGTVERHLWARGTTRGRSQLGRGEIVINNADFGVDAIAAERWDDGEMVIRRGPSTGRYPGDFTTVATGRCARVRFEAQTLVLTWRDAQAGVLDRPLFQARYGGTNALPAGVDGVEDLRGKPVPEAWGNPGRRLSPPLVNSSTVTFQVSRRQVAAIQAAADRAAPYAGPVVTHASLAALQAATVTGTEVHVYLGSAADGAYLRVATAPAALTCEVLEGAATSARSVSRLVERILTGPGGVPADRIDRASFDALHAFDGSEAGWWVSHEDDGATVGEAVDALAESIGAWVLPDETGVWYAGLRIVAGNATRAQASGTVLPGIGGIERWFDDTTIGRDGLELLWNPETDGVPAAEIVVLYSRNFTPATGDQLAGSVSAAARALAAQEYLQTVVVPAGPARALAKPLTLATRLATEAGAQASGQRARNFYGAPRLYAYLTVAETLAAGIRPGSLIGLRLDRFPGTGLAEGLPMLVIGEIVERARARRTLIAVG